jgi:hypothetical protein
LNNCDSFYVGDLGANTFSTGIYIMENISRKKKDKISADVIWGENMKKGREKRKKCKTKRKKGERKRKKDKEIEKIRS